MTAPSGIAVRCGRDGIVLDVLHDAIGTCLAPGRSFVEMLAVDSVPAALTMLTDVLAARPVRPVPLAVLDAQGVRQQLLFLAAADDAASVAVLLGAPTVSGFCAAYEAVVGSVSELAAELHRSISRSRAETEQDVAILALSEANNQLVGMHRELARANAQLELLNRRKDEILGMVSHDLRNPLSVIAGFASVLARELDPVLDDRARRMFARIQHQSQRMLALVEDLLDATLIGHEGVRLDLGSTDVVELLAAAVDAHSFTATEKGVPLELVGSAAPLHALVDGNRLTQVVDNLVTNAIKFSPPHAGAKVEVSCRRTDEGIAITVADQGIGMDLEAQQRIFEPFFHSESGTDNEPSTGLGLAITRSLVDAHGGRIEVASTVGSGSVFTVHLPTIGPASEEALGGGAAVEPGAADAAGLAEVGSGSE